MSRHDKGQVLTSVIVFMAFGLSVIALSAALTIVHMQNTLKYSESARSLNYAETGIEEALLRLVRDPAYLGGSLLIDTTSVSISVADDTGGKGVTSTAIYNGFTKKIYAVINLDNSRVTLLSWKEIL